VKIDQDYLKKLLEACQASEKPTFNIMDLKAAGFDYDEPQFEFHMKILNDQSFVELDNGDTGIGLTKSMDGFLSWSVMPLRLTASGHQFIEALENKDVWAAIKRGFKDASIDTLQSVALKLLDGFAQKKIDALLG
jgi:uncharacterized protein DUF2513